MKRRVSKGASIIVCIICYIVLGLYVYIYYMNSKNNTIDNSGQNNIVEVDDGTIKSKYETEKFYLDNLSKDGYGFAKVYYSDHIDLVELLTSGEDRVIMSFNTDRDNIWNEPYHLLRVNNNFYFEIVYADSFTSGSGWQNYNHRLFKIDLNTYEMSMVYDSKTYDILYDEYTVLNNYVFKARENDESDKPIYLLTKYDALTDEKEVLNDKLNVEELFIYEELLYVKCSNNSFKDIEINNINNINKKKEYNYLSMDIDGNNISAISENEYKEFRKKSGFKMEGYPSDTGSYFMYNNKKITIKDNKLIYNDKVIYKPKKGYDMELYYTDKVGYVALHVFKYQLYSLANEKYYLVNLETKEISEVDEEEVNDYVRLVF